MVRAMFEQAAKSSPAPSLSIDDILSTVTTGPLAQEREESVELIEQSNVVAFSPSPTLASDEDKSVIERKSETQRDSGRMARKAWWLTQSLLLLW